MVMEIYKDSMHIVTPESSSDLPSHSSFLSECSYQL